MEATSASKDTPRLIQPLISLLAFCRRLTSISHKNQSPVCCLNPDQCEAKSSSDMALSSLDVNLAGNDKISPAYLRAVRRRLNKMNWKLMAQNPGALSDYGQLIAIDLPALIEHARKTCEGNKSS